MLQDLAFNMAMFSKCQSEWDIFAERHTMRTCRDGTYLQNGTQCKRVGMAHILEQHATRAMKFSDWGHSTFILV